MEVDGSLSKDSDGVYFIYWLYVIPSLISKPNFVTLICYAFDTAITQKASHRFPRSGTYCREQR